MTFVGRKKELSQLENMLGEAKSGLTRIAILGGEPGIGKTSTATELAEVARTKDFRVWWARCYEDRGSPPNWPWIQILRSIIDTLGLEHVKEMLGENVRHFVGFVEAFRGATAAIHDGMSPQVRRFHFFDAYAGFLRSIAKLGPLLLVIDDLHRADSSSLQLLEYLSFELNASNLMILCAYRNTGMRQKSQLVFTLGELIRNDHLRHMIMEPLGANELRAIVHGVSGIELQPHAVSYLLARTEGVPLYVREIAGAMASDQDTDFGTATETILRLKVPQTLNLAVRQRLYALTDDCLQSLIRAAVIGRVYSLKLLLSSLDGVSDSAVSMVMDEAIDAGIIEEVGEDADSYRFSHVLIQEVLVQSLPNARRAEFHRKIGLLLEETYGPDAADNAEELVHHFSMAQSSDINDRLARYALIAGDSALSGYSLDEAIQYFRYALAAKGKGPMDAERAEIMSGLGRALVTQSQEYSQVSEAIGYLMSAFDFFEAAGDGEEAARIVTHSLLIPHRDRRELYDLAERALTLVPEDSLLLARVLSFHAVVAHHQRFEDHKTAINDLQRALDIATKWGDEISEMLVIFQWGIVECFECEWSASMDKIGSAIALARANDDLAVEVYAYFYASLVADRTGADRERARNGELALVAAERLRDRSLITKALQMKACVCMSNGEWSVGRDTSDRLLTLDRGVDMWGVLSSRAIMEYQTGCYGEGDEFLAALLRLCDDAGFPKLALYMIIPLSVGYLAYIRGGSVKGIDIARRVGRSHLLDKSVQPYFRLPICTGLGLLEVVEGNGAGAAEYFGLIDAMGGEAQMPADYIRVKGVLADHAGNFAEASRKFKKAMDLALRNENDVVGAWCRHDYANAMVRHLGIEGLGKAKNLLNEALCTADSLDMAPLRERVSGLIDVIEKKVRRGNDNHSEALTNRELEILRHIALGETNQEISRELQISENTVSNHIKRIYSKIGVTNRVDATTFAIRDGITTI